MPICIEIHTKGKTYKIQNMDFSRDSNESLDFPIIVEFIRTGVLPDGFFCTVNGEDVDSNVTANKLFNILIDSISSDKDINFYSLVNGNVTREEFINSIIGNYKITDVMYNPYIADQNSHGILYVANLAGNKDWYGFTNQRALIITGRKPSLNRTYDLLLNVYYELRDNKSKFIADTIEALYQDFYGDKLDNMYEMFTKLANDHTVDLLNAVRLPFMEGIKVSSKILKENFQEVIGKCIYHNNHIYVIQYKLNSDIAAITSIDTGEEIYIPLKNIKKVYTPFLLTHKNKDYYLLGRNWYQSTQGVYKKVDSKLSDEINNAWFGVNSTSTKKLNVYSAKVFQNTKLGDSTVLDQLNEGDYIQTATGIYIKQNGKLVNGELELTDNQQIISISYANDKDELFRSLININTPAVKYTKSQMVIIMADVLGITDFSNIILKYPEEGKEAKDTFRFKYVSTWDKGVETFKLMITLGNEFTEEYFRELQLAINGLNYLNNFENKTIAVNGRNDSLNDFWKLLQNTNYLEGKIITSKGEMVANADQEYIFSNISNNFIAVADALEENKRVVKQTFYQTQDIDAFIDELMSKGLYVVSCSL